MIRLPRKAFSVKDLRVLYGLLGIAVLLSVTLFAVQSISTNIRSNAAGDCANSIQSLIDAASPGDVVTVPKCTYQEEIFINKSIVLTAEPGTIVDGEGRSRWIRGGADGVTIEGFTFINTHQGRYHGGLSNDGHSNWVIRNNTFRNASNAAIALDRGTGHIIRNNTVYANGNLGVRLESVDGADIVGNEIYDNNSSGLDAAWEGGGIKITGNYGGVRNVNIENNHVHHNHGPGIWIDIDGDNVTIKGNRVAYNEHAGIIYELSRNAKIHQNIVYENGDQRSSWGFGAGILIQNSRSTEVFENVVAWNADGISIISQNRGEQRWNEVVENYIHDNSIFQTEDTESYALAWLEDWSGVLNAAASNNRGENNSYYYPNQEGGQYRYKWTWTNYGYRYLSEFNQTPGEQNGVYMSDSDKTQILTNALAPSDEGAVEPILPDPSPTSTSISTTVTLQPTVIPTQSSDQIPYKGNPISLPGTVEAEDYDIGGEGRAYHDADTGNNGGLYRSDDVDIKASQDGTGQRAVGWFRAGEWLEYTVNIKQTGYYDIQLRIGSDLGGRLMKVEFDGVDKTGWLTVPDEDGWDQYQTVARERVYLHAGQQVMRVVMGSYDYADLNWIKIVASANPTVTPTSVPTSKPTLTPSVTPTDTTPSQSGNGLTGQYFSGSNFDRMMFQRIDSQIRFDWGKKSPHSTINRDRFSVRWLGYIQPSASGTYTIYARSDDGVRVWIDNELVINAWKDRRLSESSGIVYLNGGRKVPIRVEYYENRGNAVMQLLWSSSVIQKHIIPQGVLFSN